MEDKTGAFRLEEASIEDLHAAIRAGRTTCIEVVERYLERVRAYNGVASMLVTEDGAPVPEATGAKRGGSPLRFPIETVKAADVLPELDRYKGPPLEFGRMEATASDPDVQQQYGMIAGIPNAGQVNALATLNIRGERSVTCRGDFDRHPSEGPLPPGAPPMCEVFRHYPDALERAAELDAEYGANPDLEKLPMYGVAFSFKDPFDTKDMRSTGGGDASYDIDFPARDHILVEQLRNKGAIIFAKAVSTEYNGRAGDPGGRHEPEKVLPSVLGYQRSTWGGNPSNPYDTTRAASLGSSSGFRPFGEHQYGDGEPGRGDESLLPGTVEPQRRSAHSAAQGDARLRRRGHRGGHLLRPERHHHEMPGRLRQGSRRPEGSGERLLRPARSVHDGAALLRSGYALRGAHAKRAGRRARSRGCASGSSASPWCIREVRNQKSPSSTRRPGR